MSRQPRKSPIKIATIAALAGLSVLSFSLAACDDGPAEEIGENIDDAVEDGADAVKDATN
ncbi:hypothetical protein [Oceanibacterium hippocampi]|uniref:Entericidin B membrane lipoprotein n=1 Tax=Oceanibacterium hippocampi TaxID=745714 RepID=A0A1Y5TV05_9PROT|nr:hypothetical protein [Oceanibacterium hippocampi]SLN73778.1 hypothetical protein OCH7691_03660 [Oceanibacterium hippocampi]